MYACKRIDPHFKARVYGKWNNRMPLFYTQAVMQKPTHSRIWTHTFGLTLAASSNAYTHSLTPLLVSIADHLTRYPLAKQFPARTLT